MLRRDASRPRSCGSSSTRANAAASQRLARSIASSVRQRPRVEEIEVGRARARAAPASGRPGAVVLGRVARDCERRVDRLLERRGREVGRAGVAAARLRPLAEVHRSRRALRSRLCSMVSGLPLRTVTDQAVALRHVAIAAAGAGAPRPRRAPRCARLAQLAGLAGEAVALRHGGAMITRDAGRTRQQDAAQARNAPSCRRSAPRWSSCPNRMLDQMRRSSRRCAQAVLEAKRITAHEGEAPPDAVHRQPDARRRSRRRSARSSPRSKAARRRPRRATGGWKRGASGCSPTTPRSPHFASRASRAPTCRRCAR